MTESLKKRASNVIDAAILTQKSTLLNLVDEAYQEGKKNAEVRKISELVGDALQQFYYDGVFCGECRRFERDGSSVTGFCHNPRFGDGHGNYSPPVVSDAFHCADGERRIDTE